MNDLLNAIKELDEILEFDRPIESTEELKCIDTTEINAVFAKLTKLIGEMNDAKTETVQSNNRVWSQFRMVRMQSRGAIPRFNIPWVQG